MFIVLTGFSFLKIIEFLNGKITKTIILLTVIFFPTFFNLSISTELEVGTVFFFSSTIYYYLKSLKNKDELTILKTISLLSIGLLYKQLVLGLFLSFILLTFLRFLKDKENRIFYHKLLKSFWIPFVFGFPFIFINNICGVRSFGIVWENFFRPPILFINLINIYNTLGLFIFSLVAISTIYSLWKYKTHIIYHILLIGALYYVMISWTEAVGYIRHAQPFYLIGVVFTSIFINDIYNTLRQQILSKLLVVTILSIFAIKAIFDITPFQRKTFFNRYENILPYHKVMEYLKAKSILQTKIYAPMEVEPSHFYLAKYKLISKITWNRTSPPELSAKSIIANFDSGLFDYLLLPYSKVQGMETDFKKISDEILKDEKFKKEKIFNYYGNRLILIKKQL